MTMFRQLQEQLHLMGSLVSDDEFIILLITSLPESWDQFTTAYLGANGNNTTVTSHELVAIITEENRRRQEKSMGGDSAMFSQARNHGGRTHRTPDSSDVECYNCHKKGHTRDNCWSKGGGKEGQGPRTKKKAGQGNGQRKDHANQAQANEDLKDSAYQVQESATSQFSTSFNRDDWLADSATTSHISNERQTFVDFTPLTSSSIMGVGDQLIQALGHGTVILKCKVGNEVFTHCLQDVLYAPKAVNNLLSVRRLDDAGGEFRVTQGKCELQDKSHQVIGIGRHIRRLYLLGDSPPSLLACHCAHWIYTCWQI